MWNVGVKGESGVVFGVQKENDSKSKIRVFIETCFCHVITYHWRFHKILTEKWLQNTNIKPEMMMYIWNRKER